jgi:predicted transcriptional regulator
MKTERQAKFDQFYNIRLTEFYKFATDIMGDFNYSLYRTVKEMETRHRVEVWVHGPASDEQKAIVWLEIVKPGETIDPYLTTDVLRSMNDENLTRLFFFTNTAMDEEDREVLEGANHFIFSTEEIVETLLAMESKKTIKTIKKRKTVKTASAMVLIKNFFKNTEIKKKQIRLKTSATPDLVNQYTRLIRKILSDIDKVEDINDIPPELRERLKKIQFDLLPEMARTPNYVFPRQFSHMRNLLFNVVQITIVYIGNFIEYESEDELKTHREIIEDILSQLEAVDDDVINYKNDMMYQAERNAVKIILTSGAVTFVALALLIVVRFGGS